MINQQYLNMTEYERIANLVNIPKLEKPKEFEIEQTISALKKRLQEKKMMDKRNEAILLGYKKSIEVLEDKIISLSDVDLSELTEVQSRAIVALAIDYLNGECSRKVLMGVPVK